MFIFVLKSTTKIYEIRIELGFCNVRMKKYRKLRKITCFLRINYCIYFVFLVRNLILLDIELT